MQLVQLLTDQQFVCLLFEILWYICERPFESNDKKRDLLFLELSIFIYT